MTPRNGIIFQKEIFMRCPPVCTMMQSMTILLNNTEADVEPLYRRRYVHSWCFSQCPVALEAEKPVNYF